jgi:glycine oxidase
VPNDPSQKTADVLVIGCGLIGLGCAVAAAKRGFRVTVVGEARVGASSLAAAGLLAPSIEREDGHSTDFATAARDRYPAYIEWLKEQTGIEVPLNRDGIIQVAVSEAGVRGLRRGMTESAEWLDNRQLVELEPALSHGLGGVLHPLDGFVDNVQLYNAVRTAAAGDKRIAIIGDIVTQISWDSFAVQAQGRAGTTYRTERVVLAAGAWSPMISGLPRSIPVEPLRGQMIAYAGSPLRRAVYGPTGYVVPRANARTLIGATNEHAGFESITTPEGVARLKRTGTEIIPAFAAVEPIDAWSGLRPMSTDLHPIIGVDPEEIRLIYATGHSRNGVLMTPLTGDCVAALLAEEPTPADISPFGILRFSRNA